MPETTDRVAHLSVSSAAMTTPFPKPAIGGTLASSFPLTRFCPVSESKENAYSWPTRARGIANVNSGGNNKRGPSELSRGLGRKNSLFVSDSRRVNVGAHCNNHQRGRSLIDEPDLNHYH